MKIFRTTVLLISIASVISACSGSSESVAINGQAGSEVINETMDTTLTDNGLEEEAANSVNGTLDEENDSDDMASLDEIISGTNPDGENSPQLVEATLELVPDKTFRITWQTLGNVSYYRVYENPDNISGFVDISGQLSANVSTYDHRVALYSRVNASYLVQACNSNGCVDSDILIAPSSLEEAIGYFKASNADPFRFGSVISLSADGQTLAVGEFNDDSAATGVNGNQNDSSAMGSGAVYVFSRNSNAWVQQAYVKASNTDAQDFFGRAVSLSSDGNTLAVGAIFESSNALGINGDQNDNTAAGTGAAYVFVRSGDTWHQQAYIKASEINESTFGRVVSLSSDGNTLAVSGEKLYVFERTNETWVQQAIIGGGSSVSLSANGEYLAVSSRGGVVRIFFRASDGWEEHAEVRGSNVVFSDEFGLTVNISADGDTIAVGAAREDSAAIGINSNDQFTENASLDSGAVYIFSRSEADNEWQQQAYIKASNTDAEDLFGQAISLSDDGDTLAVGATAEDSEARGINGDDSNNNASQSGAVYVFVRNEGVWRQEAYVKASNGEAFDFFGNTVSLSADGDSLAVGAWEEDGSAVGVNGEQDNNDGPRTGAVYLY